jgi:hypothetical protein
MTADALNPQDNRSLSFESLIFCAVVDRPNFLEAQVLIRCGHIGNRSEWLGERLHDELYGFRNGLAGLLVGAADLIRRQVLWPGTRAMRCASRAST